MKAENNNRVFAVSDRHRVDAVVGIIGCCFGMIANGILLFEANSLSQAVFFVVFFIIILLLGLYWVCWLRCRITISGTVITMQCPFHNEEINISRFDSYDIMDKGRDYILTFYNTNNTAIQKQSLNIKMIEEKDRFSAYLSNHLLSLGKKEAQVKKRFLPGTGTLAERKRFALFHTCTLMMAPLIGAVLAALIYYLEHSAINSLIAAGLLNPFLNVRYWLFSSLAVWNFIGALRFFSDTEEEMGFFVGRSIFAICIFVFPLVYLYNLWCILMKRDY